MKRRETVYVSRRRRNTTSNYSYGRNNNLAIFEPAKKMGITSTVVLFVMIFASLGLFYLHNATRPAVYGEEMQKIDSDIADLQSKKTDLEVENARLTALNSIGNSNVAKEMTQPTNINYAN